VRNSAIALPDAPEVSEIAEITEIDQLQTFVGKKKIRFGFNAWDQIKESLIDPDDPEELNEAEFKLRRVFKANLADYCQIDGQDIYEERVFELSSLSALPY
jgi:hypothetical protein